MLAARKLPSQSALIDAPRVILRLACWNTDGRPPAPSSRNPLKLRCFYCERSIGRDQLDFL